MKPGDAADAQAVTVSLGKLDMEAGRPVDIELLGGKDAIKGTREFTLARGEGDAGWMVRLASTAKSGTAAEQIDIARIRLDGQTLDLQFVAGVDPDRANYLRNCVLRIRVDGVPRCLPLSVAKPIDPLVLNLETGIARVSLPSDWLPETAALRMQVTKLEGDFPKHSFEQGDTAPAKGTVTVVFAGEKLPTVKLPVLFDVKGRTIRVEATATYLLADAVPRPLRARDAARVMTGLVVQQQQLPMLIKAVEQDKLRKEVAEKQLEAVKLAVEQLHGLDALCQKIHNTGKIHFRVFAAVDDQQVDLFDSQLPAGSPEDVADRRPNR